MQPQLKLCNYAEVAATAMQPPEQVRVLGLARGDHPAIGGHDARRDQVVAGQPVHPLEPAAAAAKNESGHPSGRHTAAGGCQPVFLGCSVQLTPGDARSNPSGTRDRVDLDLPHRAEVEEQAVVDGGVPSDGMAASPGRERQPCGLHKQDRRYNVAVARGPGDRRGPAVEHGVEDDAGLAVLIAVGGRQDLAREGRAQRAEVGGGSQRLPLVGRGSQRLPLVGRGDVGHAPMVAARRARRSAARHSPRRSSSPPARAASPSATQSCT